MKTAKELYDELETKTLLELREKIMKSEICSKYVNEKAIKVNVFDYEELIIINDKLVFIDANGSHYSLYADCCLEDLIDLL